MILPVAVAGSAAKMRAKWSYSDGLSPMISSAGEKDGAVRARPAAQLSCLALLSLTLCLY